MALQQVKQQSTKPKFIQIYETFLQGDDPVGSNINFWSEFLLLKVNLEFLQREIDKLDEQKIIALKPTLHNIFKQCVEIIDDESLENNPSIRTCNAMLQFSVLIHGIGRKKFVSNYSASEFFDVLCGADETEIYMKKLICAVDCYFKRGKSEKNCMVFSSIQFVLTIVLVFEHLNSNFFLKYLSAHCVIDSLLDLLVSSYNRNPYGEEVLLLSTLLAHYRKLEYANPYAVKLSVLDDHVVLTGYCQAIASCLNRGNETYFSRLDSESSSKSFMSSLASAVGSLFSGGIVRLEEEQTKSLLVTLFAMYQAVYLNRSFLNIMTHSFFCKEMFNKESLTDTDGEELGNRTNISPNLSSVGSDLEQISRTASTDSESRQSCTTPVQEHEIMDEVFSSSPTPSTNLNLVVSFLEYFSIVACDMKSESTKLSTELCFNILTIICEDQFLQSWMHDLSMCYRVNLAHPPLRHRSYHKSNQYSANVNGSGNSAVNSSVPTHIPSRPIAYAILNLIYDFLSSHMMKQFPFSCYSKALGIIHRLLIFQKKYKVRLHYRWTRLWECLAGLLKFLCSNEAHLLSKLKMDLFLIADQAVTIFNLFITCGDQILNDSAEYDQLYYEITRQHFIFETLNKICFGYAGHEDKTYKASATRLINHLVNIRGIVNHFTPKLESWLSETKNTSLTEEQVMEIVQENYSSLTLRILDSLDYVEKYSEKDSCNTVVVSGVVRMIITEARRLRQNGLPDINYEAAMNELNKREEVRKGESEVSKAEILYEN